MPENGTPSATCRTCGASFTPKPNTRGAFCSFACFKSQGRSTVTLTCFTCGATFERKAHEAKRAPRRGYSRTFCSYACRASDTQRPSLPIADRFWRHVDKHGPTPEHRPELGACWLWTGSRPRGKYGRWVDATGGLRTAYATHRLSWELANGAIPPDLLVCHQCDNPGCVRPSHLFLGTHQDNQADKVAKGRQARGPAMVAALQATRARGDRIWSRAHPELVPRGERHAHARLTEDQVRAIRGKHAAGARQSDLAEEYGVAQVTISAITRRKTWVHLD